MTAFLSQTLTRLAACKSPSDFYRLQIEIQETATPPEVALLMRASASAPGEFRTWLERVWSLMTDERPDVQPFRSKRLDANISLYTGASAAPILVIGFCGKAGLLFMPIPAVLQYFSPGTHDVLVLRDPARIGFVRGIAGHSASFLELLNRLGRDIDLGAYSEIRTLGTSGGGAAALAGGVLLQARRAVSFSGHLPMSAARYGNDPGAAAMQAVLRDAAPLRDFVCVFGAANARDARCAREFETQVQTRLRPVPEVSNHNVVFELQKKRALLPLFGEVGLI